MGSDPGLGPDAPHVYKDMSFILLNVCLRRKKFWSPVHLYASNVSSVFQ